MNKNLTILLIIIGGIAIFVLGGGLGVLYQIQKDVSQIEKLQAMESVLKVTNSALKVKESMLKGLSSKVVTSMVAQGEVVKIEGENITVRNNGETLIVSIGNNSKIYSIAKKVALNPKDIKVGDNLSITFKLLPEGQLDGQLILIDPLLGTR